MESAGHAKHSRYLARNRTNSVDLDSLQELLLGKQTQSTAEEMRDFAMRMGLDPDIVESVLGNGPRQVHAEAVESQRPEEVAASEARDAQTGPAAAADAEGEAAEMAEQDVADLGRLFTQSAENAIIGAGGKRSDKHVDKKPHVPVAARAKDGGKSGLTLGFGYDLGQSTVKEAELLLKAIQVDQKAIEVLKTFVPQKVGKEDVVLRGIAAKNKLSELNTKTVSEGGLSDFELSSAQMEALFKLTYALKGSGESAQEEATGQDGAAASGQTPGFRKKKKKGDGARDKLGAEAWDNSDQAAVKAVAADMKYRGDLVGPAAQLVERALGGEVTQLIDGFLDGTVAPLAISTVTARHYMRVRFLVEHGLTGQDRTDYMAKVDAELPAKWQRVCEVQQENYAKRAKDERALAAKAGKKSKKKKHATSAATYDRHSNAFANQLGQVEVGRGKHKKKEMTLLRNIETGKRMWANLKKYVANRQKQK